MKKNYKIIKLIILFVAVFIYGMVLSSSKAMANGLNNSTVTGCVALSPIYSGDTTMFGFKPDSDFSTIISNAASVQYQFLDKGNVVQDYSTANDYTTPAIYSNIPQGEYTINIKLEGKDGGYVYYNSSCPAVYLYPMASLLTNDGSSITINRGDPTYLYWSAYNFDGGTYLTDNSGRAYDHPANWIKDEYEQGTVTVYPQLTTTYTFVVIDAFGNQASDQVTVNVTQPAPTVTLSANPTTINSDNSATLSWTSTNATAVSIDNGVGSVSPVASGSIAVNPIIPTTYTITATGPGGTATAQATVKINPPTVTLSANPTSIDYNQPVNINYSVGNAYGYQIYANNSLIQTLGTMETTTPNYYTTTGSEGTTTLGTLMSPRCSCDVSSKDKDCPDSFSTSDTVGSVCYDNWLGTDAPKGVCHTSYCFYTTYGVDGYQKYIVYPNNPISLTYNFNLNLTTSTTFTINADGPGGTATAQATVIVKSNYKVSCSVFLDQVYEGTGDKFTATASGTVINAPLTFKWSANNCITSGSGNTQNCVVNNISSTTQPVTVTVNDPYGYSASATCPTVTIKTLPSNIQPAQAYITGGPIFYVTTSTTKSTTFNLTGALAGTMFSLIPEGVNSNGVPRHIVSIDSNGNFSWPGYGCSSGQMGGWKTCQDSDSSELKNFIVKFNNNSHFIDQNGSFNSFNIDLTCNDIGVWRLYANFGNSAIPNSTYAVFAVAPDPNVPNACGTK